MKKLDKKNIQDILELTPMQQGILFHYLKEPGSDYYFEQLSLKVSGEIHLECFEKAWNFVIAANDMLRTVFRWEQVEKPIQIILKEWKLKPNYHDLSKRDRSKRKKYLEDLKTKDRQEKFNLQEVPFRVILCKVEKAEYEMIISYHHILYDGWSNGIILKEFFNAYSDLSKGRELIKPVKNKFREFVQWILQQGAGIDRQKNFWANYLKGFDTQTELPVKQKRKGKETGGSANYQIGFEKDVKDEIENFVKRYKITLASLLYSAWGILLQRYNNTDDVVFGTTVSGRSTKLKGIEEIVGLFIHTLPLRINAHADEKIEDFLSNINNTLQMRATYETTPLMEIKKVSELDSKEEFFDNIVIIENYPLNTGLMLNNSVLSAESYSMFETTHYDLVVEIMLFDNLAMNFIYREDRFARDTIERLSGHFSGILKDIVNNPCRKISELEILPEEEKKKLLYEFNNTETDYPKDKPIHRLFEEQVNKTPDHIGAVGVHELHERYERRKLHIHITYRGIDRKSGQLAHLLTQEGVGQDTVVGIMVERSVEMVIGIIGILKAGGAYLPIDPGSSAERAKYILADSGAKVLVTTSNLSEEVQNLRSLEVKKNFEAISIDFIDGPGFSSAYLLNFSTFHSSNLAYIIYTSGSSGHPKGVMVGYHSVINLLFAMHHLYPLKKTDTFLLKTSYLFDVSVTELFGWFLEGGRLAILDMGGEKDPGKIVDIIERIGVTHINFVPSVFNVFLDILTPENKMNLSGLKYIFLGGEAVLGEMMNKFRRLNLAVDIVNIYGPTEATVYTSKYPLSAWDGWVNIPIGKPLPNMMLFVLDIRNHLQPIGVPGELCIGGVGVARGYLNRPELTADRFLAHELHELLEEKKLYLTTSTNTKNLTLYKTGDLARWLSDGNIEYLGRMDHQVKIRGFRIELGEIEKRLVSHRKVKEALVVAKEIEGGDKYLGAYIVPAVTIETLLLVGELKEYLSRALPDYMIPAYFLIIDNIPRTPSGKVDRKTLPALVINSRQEYAPPQDEKENTLVDIWAEVLGIDKKQIGINDNFFDLGGHSLKVVGLIGRIHKKLNIEVPFNKIFQAPTVKDLAQYIRKKEKSQYSEIPPVEKKECYPMSSAQKRLFVLQQMEAGCTAYNMHGIMKLAGPVDKEKLENVFAQFIARHESLRTSFEMIAGELVQRIHEEVEFKIEWYDSGKRQKAIGSRRQEAVSNREELIPESVIKNFIRHFDLSQAPLLRVGVMEGNPGDKNILMVDLHHIISDSVSHTILKKDFIDLYKGNELSPLPLQYKDFSQWQNREEQKELLKKQVQYWLKAFSGELPVLNLPTDYERPKIKSFEGNTVSFELNEKETNILKNIAKEADVTLYMVISAAFIVLISKISGQEDIIIGTPTAGRTHIDLEGIIGIFVNILAIRNFPIRNKTFRKFLHEVKTRTLEAFSNQEYQFENLVDRLLKKRDPSRNPIFDVVFNFLNQSNIKNRAVSFIDNIDENKEVIYNFRRDTAQFDINLLAIDFEERIQFNLEYCTKLFKLSTIERFIEYFKTILSSLSLTIDQELSDIEIINPQEKEEFLTIPPFARD